MMANSLYDIASGLLTDRQICSDYDEQQRPRRVTSRWDFVLLSRLLRWRG
jgi:hypothetical protein